MFYTSGDSVGFTTKFVTSSKSNASDVKDVTSGVISLYRGLIKSGPVKTLAQQVSVKQDGSTVTISAEASASKVDKAIKSASNSSGSPFTGIGGSSTSRMS